MKAVAVEIDDVLNDFAGALCAEGIKFDPLRHSLSDPLLKRCLYDYAAGTLTEPARQAMAGAEAWEGAADFLGDLKKAGFKVALLTRRDLRFCHGLTARWLFEGGFIYDCLFEADDSPSFCREMGIGCLVAARPARAGGVTVFAPARGGAVFEEVKKCLLKHSF